MDVTEAPPAPPAEFTRRCGLGGGDARGEPGIGGFEVGLEQGKDAGNGGEDGDAFATDGLNQAGRDQTAFKVDFGAKDGRDPDAHGLAEDVAQREGVKKAQRVDESLIAHVTLRGLLDGFHAGEHVSVGVHDALGVAGGAGGEEDLQGRVESNSGYGRGLMVGQARRPFFKLDAREIEVRTRGEAIEEQRISNGEFWLYVGGHAGGEIGAAHGVERNGQRAAEDASVQRGDPLGAVLAPDEDAIAHADGARFKQGGKAPGETSDLAICGHPAANALVADYGNFCAGAAEVLNECGQIFAHGPAASS